MKKTNYLKGVRVILALLFFLPILLFFIDFADVFPDSFHRFLHMQLMPALLGGFWGIVILELLLTFIFGRIYCSVICPAGILQDLLNRLYCIGKKKRQGSHRFTYRQPKNLIRYSLLALTAFSLLSGMLNLYLLLDPYSNFGRIATNLFRPIIMWGNNGLAEVLMKMDNYTLYQVTISTVTAAGWISGLTALVILAVMSLRGRLFCNTICPVGTLLSLVSRYSLFRITIDKQTCVHCGNCEHTCKAEAIDSKNMTVDTSRCVACFNCLSSCAKNSLGYQFKLGKDKQTEKENTPQAASNENAMKRSRRSFIASSATVAATLPALSALAEKVNKLEEHRQHDPNDTEGKDWDPITPPGSLSIERFKDLCTGCHLCITQCPSQVLRPAGLQYGFGYMLKPHVSYLDSYCNYECTVCSDVCPSHAIKPISKEEKATTQVGVAHFFINRCIVNTENTDCGACSEHCPTQAVRMVPYKGTLTIPQVNPDLCIGCGGCESICPVRPMRAIMIKANPIHKRVEKPKEEKVKDIEVTDFGF